MREAAGEVLAANDRNTHALVGTRGLARAKVEYADALDKLRRSLQANAGKDYISADAAAEVRRYFTMEDLTPERQTELKESILRSIGPG
jgi:hypothetical protein